MTKHTIYVFFVITFLFQTLKTEAQFLYNRYVNLKFGQGVVFGGWGLNVEYRVNHFSLSVDGGHQGKQYVYDHNVASSYNIGGAIRYYYFRKQGSWQLFSGIYSGWLSDYYNPDIAERPYHSTVYGAAFLFGLEIREELFNVEIGSIIDPGILILSSTAHPYYNKSWYITPGFGIGVNLYALHYALKSRKQYKRFPSNVKVASNVIDTTARKVANATHEKLIQQQAINIINSCGNAPAAFNEKAYYQNDTLYIFKQVGIRQFIYGKIFFPNAQSESFYTTSIEPNSKLIKLYIIEDNVSVQSPDELSTLTEVEDNLSEAKQGLLSLYIHDNTCYVKLEQVSFKKNNINIYFDSISLCKMVF